METTKQNPAATLPLMNQTDHQTRKDLEDLGFTNLSRRQLRELKKHFTKPNNKVYHRGTDDSLSDSTTLRAE